MRYEATATCLSWIPPTAVEGVFSLPFGLGVAHFDQPPPDHLPEIEALLSADAIRFANQLHAWIEVQDGQVIAHGMSGGGHLGSTTVRLRSRGLTFAGVALPDLIPPPEVHAGRVRFTQTAGGHTGVPVPRAVSRPPFWQLTAPIAWSTIALTLGADGSSTAEIAAASRFPRHYLYDGAGRLTHKSAVIRYKDWIRGSAQHETPWEGGGEPVPITAVKGPAERSLADTILVSGEYRQQDLPEGALLRERPIADTEVHLLLDGLLLIEIDQEPALEVGPGAIFDPATRPRYSKEHATVRARTPCRLAVLRRDQLDSQALLDSAAEQASRLNAYLENRDRRQSLAEQAEVEQDRAIDRALSESPELPEITQEWLSRPMQQVLKPLAGGASGFHLHRLRRGSLPPWTLRTIGPGACGTPPTPIRLVRRAASTDGHRGMIGTCDHCNAQRGPWEDAVCPVMRTKHGWFLDTAYLAVHVLEESDTALTVYDIKRSIRRDLGIDVSQETLQVSISGDRRFCWAGKGLYGLYRHGLIPGGKLPMAAS